MVNNRLLDADAVAEMLGMGRDWVYAETRAGRIPHVKLGRYYRYRRASIDAWIAQSERGTGTETNKRGRDARTPGPLA